ncbi:MAG: tetratricopeptide repeat protein [Candidatus Melainabacteria bacterium]
MNGLFESPIALLLLLVVILVVVWVVMTNPTASRVLGKEMSDSPEEPPEPEEVLDYHGHINRGNQYLSSYEYDKAMRHFQMAMKINNVDPALHFKIGRVYLQKEDPANAEVYFRQVIKLNPEQVEAYYELARLGMLQNKPEKALEFLDGGLAVQAGHEPSIKLKLKILAQLERYQDTLPILKHLIDTQRADKKIRMAYAEHLYKANRTEEAREAFTQLSRLFPEDRFLFDCHLGRMALAEGLYLEAIQYIRPIMQSEDALADNQELRSQFAAALCNEGVRLFDAGDNVAALQNYKEALSYDEHNPDIYFNLGKAYMAENNLEKAARNFKSVIALLPDDLASLYELGVIADQTGQFGEAVDYYEKVLAKDPEHVNANFALGSLYGVRGDMDKAVDYLTRCIKADPNFADAIYNLGVALERQKQYNKAMAMYKKVLSIDAMHEQARSNLVHLERSQKK